MLGDLTKQNQTLLVARGGQGGLGNIHFKSSTNQTPRRVTLGQDSENRKLRLELQILADVGLLGLPNAGKSTFIRAVSAARPKVADYPFTTLHPQLGVVSVSEYQSFVVADIPGLIEGAAEGVGLGIHFLKHLSRTRLLLHLIDVAPPTGDPANDAQSIVRELEKYSAELAAKERWIIFNKIDMLASDVQKKECEKIVKKLNWQGHVFEISALSGQGCKNLCQQIMQYLEDKNRRL